MPIFRLTSSAILTPDPVSAALAFPSETLLVDGVGLPLNPLFHYPGTVGYWNRPRNNLFEARVSGSGAFSVEYGGAYHRDQHFLHRSVPCCLHPRFRSLRRSS